jgi:hypothetical protein
MQIKLSSPCYDKTKQTSCMPTNTLTNFLWDRMPFCINSPQIRPELTIVVPQMHTSLISAVGKEKLMCQQNMLVEFELCCSYIFLASIHYQFSIYFDKKLGPSAGKDLTVLMLLNMLASYHVSFHS